MTGARARCASAALVLALHAAAPGARAQDSIPAAPPYSEAAAALVAHVERARADHDIPAISVALVADGRIVFARGFGWADSAGGRPANATTLYRVGSISKMVTALALMRLVAEGRAALDAPVATLLPEVPTGITLRQLLAHRSGLPREPPAGHYFDATSPSLATAVLSLRGTPPVFQPGTRFKYSNAAYAVAGRVLERITGAPFERHLRDAVLEPLGMRDSGFTLAVRDTAMLAHGLSVGADGTRLPAPRFDIGAAPAVNLVSSAIDLARLAAALLDSSTVVSVATRDSMWRPQLTAAALRTGYGLGFRVGSLDGHSRIGHSGAVHGFVTELAMLPESRTAAVVLASRDLAGPVVRGLADEALRALRGEVNVPPVRHPVPDSLARLLSGRWAAGPDTIQVRRRGGALVLDRAAGIARVTLRAAGDTVLVHDALQVGPRLLVKDSARLAIEGVTYTRVADPRPPPAPAQWLPLIGEYGPDHGVAHILEANGRLTLQIGPFRAPLRELAADTFALPDGLFAGERVTFARGGGRRALRATVGGMALERRELDGEAGATFRIRPQRPVEELRTEALAAAPPSESGEFLASDLVELRGLDPSIHYDIRYAGTDNFMGAVFYSSEHAFLQRPAALAVVRAAARLRDHGYGLLIHDAYRPWYVTRMFWDATPEALRDFVADPARGSRHNRGAAVDLSLYELASGRPVEMVSGYDEFSARAHPEYPGGASRERWHRELLRDAMEAEGFTVYPAEWWHFDYRDWQRYRIDNRVFEELVR